MATRKTRLTMSSDQSSTEITVELETGSDRVKVDDGTDQVQISRDDFDWDMAPIRDRLSGLDEVIQKFAREITHRKTTPSVKKHDHQVFYSRKSSVRVTVKDSRVPNFVRLELNDGSQPATMRRAEFYGRLHQAQVGSVDFDDFIALLEQHVNSTNKRRNAMQSTPPSRVVTGKSGLDESMSTRPLLRNEPIYFKLDESPRTDARLFSTRSTIRSLDEARRDLRDADERVKILEQIQDLERQLSRLRNARRRKND